MALSPNHKVIGASDNDMLQEGNNVLHQMGLRLQEDLSLGQMITTLSGNSHVAPEASEIFSSPEDNNKLLEENKRLEEMVLRMEGQVEETYRQLVELRKIRKEKQEEVQKCKTAYQQLESLLRPKANSSRDSPQMESTALNLPAEHDNSGSSPKNYQE